jgi:hypothetical protein
MTQIDSTPDIDLKLMNIPGLLDNLSRTSVTETKVIPIVDALNARIIKLKPHKINEWLNKCEKHLFDDNNLFVETSKTIKTLESKTQNRKIKKQIDGLKTKIDRCTGHMFALTVLKGILMDTTEKRYSLDNTGQYNECDNSNKSQVICGFKSINPDLYNRHMSMVFDSDKIIHSKPRKSNLKKTPETNRTNKRNVRFGKNEEREYYVDENEFISFDRIETSRSK